MARRLPGPAPFESIIKESHYGRAIRSLSTLRLRVRRPSVRSRTRHGSCFMVHVGGWRAVPGGLPGVPLPDVRDRSPYDVYDGTRRVEWRNGTAHTTHAEKFIHSSHNTPHAATGWCVPPPQGAHRPQHKTQPPHPKCLNLISLFICAPCRQQNMCFTRARPAASLHAGHAAPAAYACRRLASSIGLLSHHRLGAASEAT